MEREETRARGVKKAKRELQAPVETLVSAALQDPQERAKMAKTGSPDRRGPKDLPGQRARQAHRVSWVCQVTGVIPVKERSEFRDLQD